VGTIKREVKQQQSGCGPERSVGFSPLTALHGLIEENEELVPDPDLTNDDASVSYSHSHGKVNLDSVKSIDIKSGLAVRKLSEADSVRKLADTFASIITLTESLNCAIVIE
jgi:hypothetical protein